MKNGKLMKVLIASTLALAVVQPVSVFAEDSETVYSSSDGSWETVNQKFLAFPFEEWQGGNPVVQGRKLMVLW